MRSSSSTKRSAIPIRRSTHCTTKPANVSASNMKSSPRLAESGRRQPVGDRRAMGERPVSGEQGRAGPGPVEIATLARYVRALDGNLSFTIDVGGHTYHEDLAAS